MMKRFFFFAGTLALTVCFVWITSFFALKADLLSPSDVARQQIARCVDGNGDGVRSKVELKTFLVGLLRDVIVWVSRQGTSSPCTVATCPIEQQCRDIVSDGQINRADLATGLLHVRFLLTCGNGVLDVDEQCDDGNARDGDGCSAECTTENPPLTMSSLHNGTVQVVRLPDMPALVGTSPVVHNGALYLVGGIDEHTAEQGGFYRFRQTLQTWERLGTLPAGKYDVGAASMSGALLAIAGKDRLNVTSDIMMWDDQKSVWTKKNVRSSILSTYLVSALQAFVFDGLLWTFQGVPANSSNQPSSYVFTDENSTFAWNTPCKSVGFATCIPNFSLHTPVEFQEKLWFSGGSEWLNVVTKRKDGGTWQLTPSILPHPTGSAYFPVFLFRSQGKLWQWAYKSRIVNTRTQEMRYTLFASSTIDGIVWDTTMVNDAITLDELPQNMMTIGDDVYILGLQNMHTFFARLQLPL